MATRSVSPGAALLRSSRMFSMPTPIPAAPGDYSFATTHHSATATTPYPTHLTITTPSTSRITGDWGLKRSLPLKTTTKQTYPLVRVRQVDSIEYITDFQSASDHSITLKKFQQLNMPISMPVESESDKLGLTNYPRSVFEEDGDVTAIDPEQAVEIENKRWRFKGPWLAGMSDGEFNRWLEKRVRTRRSEFHTYLKEVYAKELTEEQAREAIQEKRPIPPKVNASDVTEAQFIDYLRDIRQDRLVLFRLVSRFLDLAPLSTDTEFLPSMKANRPQFFNKNNPYGISGPPITHPSAGLSYLRTPNFIDNHPIYGPQRYHPPVKARILKPRNPSTGVHHPVIGVAGFVADHPLEQWSLGSAAMLFSERGKALAQLELDRRGGSKLYYKVDSATVDSTGKIRISVSDPGSKQGETVQKELLGEDDTHVYKSSMESGSLPEVPFNLRFKGFQRRSQIYGSKESYGFSPKLGQDM
ncbi:hypothetical protein F5Y19DRAFT_453946 [Xylariaceae sp. FL1651]|nr:hypothetical protein F5Y19DRAFT_453946 [Xylariaceae sp. FL1651]